MIEQLIKSLDEPDPLMDDLWKKEVESRLGVYDEKRLTSVTVREAIAKYKK